MNELDKNRSNNRLRHVAIAFAATILTGLTAFVMAQLLAKGIFKILSDQILAFFEGKDVIGGITLMGLFWLIVIVIAALLPRFIMLVARKNVQLLHWNKKQRIFFWMSSSLWFLFFILAHSVSLGDFLHFKVTAEEFLIILLKNIVIKVGIPIVVLANFLSYWSVSRAIEAKRLRVETDAQSERVVEMGNESSRTFLISLFALCAILILATLYFGR